MKKGIRDRGKKHRLLFYRHTMDRIWRMTLLLNITLWLTWWRARGGHVRAFVPPNDVWILVAALIALFIMVFAFISRNMSYVQARRDHLLLVTPFLRLKIAYRRMKSIRPVDFGHLFAIGKSGWADKRFLQPYYGMTVLAMNTQGYPMSPAVLRFFLPKHIFHPKDTGFIFVISDWMGLSTELESLRGTWRESQASRPTGPSLRGMYGQE